MKKTNLDDEFLKFEQLLLQKEKEKGQPKLEPPQPKPIQKQEISKPPTTEIKPELKIQTIASAKPQYNMESLIQPTTLPTEKKIIKFEAPDEDTSDKKRKFVREAGGEVWVDDTLSEWPQNDFRIFVGDLGPETNDQKLAEAFSQFKSLAKAKVVRDKRTMKSKGFGFVSFLNPEDGVQALETMDGKYIGSRPCSLKKSSWEDRDRDTRKKKKHNKF